MALFISFSLTPRFLKILKRSLLAIASEICCNDNIAPAEISNIIPKYTDINENIKLSEIFSPSTTNLDSNLNSLSVLSLSL